MPYVVCVGVDAETGAVKGDGKQPLAERAYHPEEVRESNGALAVDIDFYLAQQARAGVADGSCRESLIASGMGARVMCACMVSKPSLVQSTFLVDADAFPGSLAPQVHPVVSRLCTHIDGTDPAHLAHHLGLDASKFHARPAATPYRCGAMQCLCTSLTATVAVATTLPRSPPLRDPGGC